MSNWTNLRKTAHHSDQNCNPDPLLDSQPFYPQTYLQKLIGLKNAFTFYLLQQKVSTEKKVGLVARLWLMLMGYFKTFYEVSSRVLEHAQISPAALHCNSSKDVGQPNTNLDKGRISTNNESSVQTKVRSNMENQGQSTTKKRCRVQSISYVFLEMLALPPTNPTVNTGSSLKRYHHTTCFFQTCLATSANTHLASTSKGDQLR